MKTNCATNRLTRSAVTAVTVLAMDLIGLPTAGASSHIVCQLLAAGNTPQQVATSTAVKQMLGGDPTIGEGMVFVRSVVAGQCPQFLWRF